MGADFLLSMVSHRTNVQPDWTKANAAIDKLTEADIACNCNTIAPDPECPMCNVFAFEDLDASVDGNAYTLKAVKQVLHEKFRDLETILTESREISMWRLAGYTCYFSGGLSHGDAPTEPFEAFVGIEDCGPLGQRIYYAAGFEHLPQHMPMFTIQEQETPA